MKHKNLIVQTGLLIVVILLLIGCTAPEPTATPVPPTPTPGPPPPARGYHNMVYDIESDRVILLGGQQAGITLVSDIWAYSSDANAWQKISDESPYVVGSVAYDSQSDQIVTFIGTIPDPPTSFTPTGKTQTYDYNSNSWAEMETEPAPFGQLGPSMVYDSESDRVILFGGFNTDGTFAFVSETWAYDFDTNSWEKMNLAIKPPGRNFAPMVYDAESDRVILFGGNTTSGAGNDTWLYDYNSNSWEEMKPDEKPHVRTYTAMVYDVESDRVILFGGEYSSEVLDDTWSYDTNTNTWAELKPNTHPDARGWHDMAYDTNAKQTVLFGGGRNRDEYTNETWVYDSATNEWTDKTVNSEE